MKKKRFLSLTLAACLLFGSAAMLPENTFTDSTSITASAEVYYDLKVSGIRVTDETKDDILRKGNNEAAYDPDTNTLILKKDITVDTNFDGITVNKAVTIRVDNDVKITVTNTNYSAIRCNADTTITGNGKLTLQSKYAGIYSNAKDVTIKNADISIASNYFGIYGLCNSNKLTIDNSNVDVQTNLLAVGNYYGIILNNCEIITPAEAKIITKSSSSDELFITDKNGNNAKTVEILSHRSRINNTACERTASTAADGSILINGEKTGISANNIPLGEKLGVMLSDSRQPDGMRLNYWKASYSIDDYNDTAHGYKYRKETTFTQDTFIFDFPDEAITGLWNYFKDNDIDLSTYDWSKIKFKIYFTPVYVNCEHENVTLHEAKAETCTQDGNIKYYKCEDCKLCFTDEALTIKIAEKDTVIPSKWHEWGETVYEWEPDGSACTATRICKKDPTHIETETAAAYRPGHKAATCTQDGSDTYLAIFDNPAFKRQEKVIVVKASGHKWGDWVTKIKPTCTENGEKWRKCSVCDEYETDDIEKLGHRFGEWSVLYSATCTSDGMRGHICTVCSTYETETIEKLGHNYKDTVVKPTCTQRGYTRHGCTRCSDGYNYAYTDALGHKYGEWQILRQPTCAEPGLGEHTCSVCHITSRETIDKLSEHSFGDWQIKVKPTCTYDGYKERTCSVCRFTERETIDKLSAHTFGDWQIKVKPTCTYEGIKTRTCSSCFYVETAAIEKLGHNYKTQIINPTCTDKGYTLHKCSECGSSYKDTYKDATGHSFGKWTTTTEPTCTAKGVETRTCSECKKAETRDVNALGHDYVASIIPPTCTSKGYTNHKCTRCKDEYNDTETQMTAHSFGDWRETTAPTCTAKGVETRTCSECKKTETRDVNALGHDYKATVVAPTCTQRGYTNHKCSRCNDEYQDNVTEVIAHTFSEWSVTKKPTCTEKGIESRKCEKCNETETRNIDALGHKWSEWKTTAFDVAKGTSTQTRTCSVCNKAETKTTKNAIQRLAGAGRYETAVEISKAGFPDGSDTVVLAYGLNYADALAGVSLAKAKNAPILLTNLKTLPAETLAEIKRLKAKNVIILGGTGAVGKEVEAALNKEGLKTERIAGATRFETATKIAQKMQVLNDNKAPEDIFFVYAFNSADALSVSAVAAVKGAPVIYLKTTGDLDDATAAYLKSIKGSVKNAYVIGGEGVISKDMMKKTRNALGVTPVRVFGANRFETCVAVNNRFSDVLDGDMLCVATGMDFPDALAGGVYAAINKAPLFLINGKAITPQLSDEQKAYLKTKAAGKITAFGGTGVVPDNHIADIAKNSI